MFGINVDLLYNEYDLMNTLAKGVSLQPHQVQVQIERSVQKTNEDGTKLPAYKKVQFVILSMDELSRIVEENPNISFHEITNNTINKMFFDIESKGQEITENEILTQIRNIVSIFNENFQKYEIHIASAHGVIKDDFGKVKLVDGNPVMKYSFHVVVDIACYKNINKFIAERLSPLLYNAVDTGVYSQNHAMRLPNTVKITKHGVIEDRKFVI